MATVDGELEPIPLSQLSNAPRVSVLITNYNYASFLDQAITSVFSQTYGDIEIVVCDDGSTDDSVAALRRLESLHGHLDILIKGNGGQASALNAAYARCKGDVICLLDADDYFGIHKVERVLEALRADDVGFVVHPLTLVNTEGHVIGSLSNLNPSEQGWIADAVLHRGGRWRSAPTSGISLRREAARVIFPLPEEAFRISADGFIFTLAPLLTRVGVLPESLAFYRQHTHNATAWARETSAISSDRSAAVIARISREVNERLAERAVRPRLNVGRNGAYVTATFKGGLLADASRSRLFAQWATMTRLLINDGFHSRFEAGVLAATFLVAICLPRPFRPGWIRSSAAGLRVTNAWLSSVGRRETRGPTLMDGDL